MNVPFHKPSISDAEKNAVLKVLDSGWLTTGKVALEFEKRFADFMNSCNDEVSENRKKLGLSSDCVQCLAVNSNTSGLILAMRACGVGVGTAIITTPYTFVSTASSARHLGADVYFCDIEKDSYNIDAEKIEAILENDAKNGKKVRAIVAVHIGGNVCNMKKICEIAKKYDVKVIEDAAHSFPSKTSLGFAGTIGDIGVFSFYATKTITTGEGGMISVRDETLFKKMEILRSHGMDRTTWDRYTSPRASWEYDIVELGYKFNMPDILASIGLCQIEKANDFLMRRCEIAKKYNEAFSLVSSPHHASLVAKGSLNDRVLKLPPDGEGNCWHLYLLRLDSKKVKISRNDFAKKLQEAGVGISVHFIPLFHFTYWKKLYSNFSAENFPNAEEKYSETVSLPIWSGMTDEMVDYVIKMVYDIVGVRF